MGQSFNRYQVFASTLISIWSPQNGACNFYFPWREYLMFWCFVLDTLTTRLKSHRLSKVALGGQPSTFVFWRYRPIFVFSGATPTQNETNLSPLCSKDPFLLNLVTWCNISGATSMFPTTQVVYFRPPSHPPVVAGDHSELPPWVKRYKYLTMAIWCSCGIQINQEQLDSQILNPTPFHHSSSPFPANRIITIARDPILLSINPS